MEKYKDIYVEGISLDIYPVNIALAIGKTAIKKAQENYKLVDSNYKIECPKGSNMAVCLGINREDNSFTCVLCSNSASIQLSALIHEITHIALIVFEYIDAKVDFSNQEPFTYLVGYITSLILDHCKANLLVE